MATATPYAPTQTAPKDSTVAYDPPARGTAPIDPATIQFSPGAVNPNPSLYKTSTTPYSATPTTVNSTNTAPAAPVVLPSPPIASKTGTNAMTQLAGTAAAATVTTPATPPATATTDADTAFQTYLKSIQAPTSTADEYTQAKADAGVAAKQQEVNTYQAQLNAITAKAQADKLSLVGQGNGVPNPIIGGQQAEIDREAAIQALPVSAQLAAAQSNLTLAQDNLDTLFKLRSEDAQAQVTYKNNVITAVYNYANEKQKTQLDAIKTANAQNFTTQQNNLNYAQTLATAAITNGQPGIASQLMKLDHTDPNYAANIATLAKGIVVTPKSGNQTVAEKQDAATANLQSIISSGQKLKNGDSVTDDNGYMTPAAWNAFINEAPAEGLTRNAFIKNFGYLLYKDPDSGNIPSSYKLSPQEQKLVTGVL